MARSSMKATIDLHSWKILGTICFLKRSVEDHIRMDRHILTQISFLMDPIIDS